MSRFRNKLTIEDACAKVEGLDILNNSAAKQVFLRVVIDYSRAELRKDGIDLLTVAEREELYTYCQLWLRQHPEFPNDMALIGLSYAVQSKTFE